MCMWGFAYEVANATNRHSILSCACLSLCLCVQYVTLPNNECWAQKNLNTRNCTCNCSDVEGHTVSSWHFPLHRQRFMYMDRYQIQLDIAYSIAKSKHKQANVGSAVSAILNTQILHKNTRTRERQRQGEKDKEEERGTKKPENKRERGRPDFLLYAQTGVRCGQWFPWGSYWAVHVGKHGGVEQVFTT